MFVFHAGIAQSVEQLIRNQQVVCSSHIASSKKPIEKERLDSPQKVCATVLFSILINLLVEKSEAMGARRFQGNHKMSEHQLKQKRGEQA